MAHDVFISHSSKDKAHADALCAALEAARLRCWVAPRDVIPGQPFSGQIVRAIEEARVMVLVFSGNANGSEEVLREVQLAARSHVHIFNFRLADVPVNDDLDYYLSVPHWLDAVTPPVAGHHARLVGAIRALLPPPAPPGVAPPAAIEPPPAPPPPAPPVNARRFPWPVAVAASLLLMAGTAAFLGWRATRRSPVPAPVATVNPATTTATPAPAASSPRTLQVKPGESIQAALNAARPGDTVRVAAGEYTEALTFPEGVHLVGEGADKTFVRFDGAQGNVLLVKRCGSGEIANLCFEHTGALREKGLIAVVWINHSAVELHHCVVRNSPGTGVYLDGGDRSTVRDCEVHHCYWSGLWVAGEGTASTLNTNHVYQNRGSGICFGTRAGGTATANRCESNSWNGILVSDAQTAPSLVNNQVGRNQSYGILFQEGAGGRAAGNTCQENQESGIGVLNAGTAPTLVGNRCTQNRAYGIQVGLGAMPTGTGIMSNELSENSLGPTLREAESAQSGWNLRPDRSK